MFGRKFKKKLIVHLKKNNAFQNKFYFNFAMIFIPLLILVGSFQKLFEILLISIKYYT